MEEYTVENYLITNKTIALLKRGKKTLIYDVDKVVVINKTINKIIDLSCNYYGSSLEGRKKSAKNILNQKYKIPIVIDEVNNLILIPLNNPRLEDCLYVVVNKIVDYYELEDNLVIMCVNNQEFKTKMSKKTLEKLIISAFKLNNILNHRKNANFL